MMRAAPSLAYDQWRALLRDERLPAALVDRDAFDRNLDRMAALVDGAHKKLRLASKSLRVPALLARALGRGRPFQGLMCYSAEEAAFLVDNGFDDLLVAYPTLRASDLGRLARAHGRGARVTLAVDGNEGVRALAAAAAEAVAATGRRFPVIVDCDVSLRLAGGRIHLGVRRSPVRADTELEALADEIGRHPSLALVGAMAYEAQVAGLGDRNPWKRMQNPFAARIRSHSVTTVARDRARIAALFARREIALELFNGGGSGSLTFTLAEPHLTEVTAGSGLLGPHLFDHFSNITFEPALFFALQAVRRSDAGYVTCQGGGYVASGAPAPDRLPLPHLPDGARLLPHEGAGEVQTPVRLPEGTSIDLGDPVLFRPAKSGELAERFHEYLIVSDGKIVERAKTYRGMNQCFF